jgi:hypothetical protein
VRRIRADAALTVNRTTLRNLAVVLNLAIVSLAFVVNLAVFASFIPFVASSTPFRRRSRV